MTRPYGKVICCPQCWREFPTFYHKGDVLTCEGCLNVVKELENLKAQIKKPKDVGDKSNQRCWYCGCEIVKQRPEIFGHDKRASYDHQQPVSKGGADNWDNLVLACRSCNTEKGCLTLEEYRAVIQVRRNRPQLFYGESYSTYD